MDKEKPYIINGERISHDDYTKVKYEDLRIRVPKGKKEVIQSHVQQQSKSLNGFVNEAIDEKIERDNTKDQ